MITTSQSEPKNSPKQARHAALVRTVTRLDVRIHDLKRTSDQFSTLRLLLALFGGAAIFLSTFVGGPTLFLAALVLFSLVFAGVVVFHRRVTNTIRRYETWRQIKKTHLARMSLDWAKLPPALGYSAEVPRLHEHPFEIDLDMTGEYSIHQLLDTAISVEGGETLRDWLLAVEPNDSAQISARQMAVRALRDKPTFRDKLTLFASLAARDTNERWEGRRLVNWIAHHESASEQKLNRWLVWLCVLAVVNIGLFVAYSIGLLQTPLMAISFVVYFGALLTAERDAGDLFENALSLEDALRRLRAILGFLETTPHANREPLATLCAPFTDKQNRPTRFLRRIGRVVAAVSIKQNPLLWFAIHVVVPWDIGFALLLSRYRTALAALLPGWLTAWYDLEALCSLATFAYLNPEYAFPEISTEEFAFEGEALGHPLIPADRKISNDFRLESQGEVVIITGSNMAGKSSFLRTLGVNLCLAYAGGPVNAAHLQVSLFRLFTCIRVSDSVTDGFSYFYAEVRRLKALLNALEGSHTYPLFFLIDEIFRGTNNRERLIGSRAYIRALTSKHGAGVISTHDLELVKLADENPEITNMHFREEVINGRMEFDYKLRPGPSPTTNALRIMALEGLPIDMESVKEP